MNEKQIGQFCAQLGGELWASWRAARHEKTREHLRLCELAERVGVTETTLRTLFRGGKKQMDIKTVLRVCAALNVCLSAMMYDIENRKGS